MSGGDRMNAGGGAREISGGTLLSVPGLSGAGVHCGVKESGELDLAVVKAEQPMAAAGVFTRNQLPAAPVELCREQLALTPWARSVVVNSGNANAMTGPRGVEDAHAMQTRLVDLCGEPGLVLSTGVIGVPMPMDRVLGGIERAARACSTGSGDDVARAMLTTDTTTKTCAVRVEAGGESYTVGGVAKGSGMIHPDMATMLALIATDAPLVPGLCDELLRVGVDRSFHEITVDGDTSTNDSVLLLAGSREAAAVLDDPDDPRVRAVAAAVEHVADRLARMIVLDGEGATRLMELEVIGAASAGVAREVARSVADSVLVKTALAGGDPNWGRILAAAANAGAELRMERLSLRVGDVQVFRQGQPVPLDRAAAERAMSSEQVQVVLDLGSGDGAARMLTSDLTHDYVTINSEYTT